MRTKGLKFAGMAALCGVCATGIVLGATGETAKRAAPKAAVAKDRLVGFDSCARLQAYTRARAAALVGPYGLAGYGGGGIAIDERGAPMPVTSLPAPLPSVASPAAPATDGGGTAGVDYSGTNVQEEGVDEPDIVKTNGRTMFVAGNGVVRALSVSGGATRPVGTLKLDELYGDAQLLLTGNRLVVISSGVGPMPTPMPAVSVAPAPGEGDATGGAPAPGIAVAPIAPGAMPYFQGTVVRLIDVSNPGAMRVLETMRLEGRYLAAREADGAVRLVISSSPDVVGMVYPATGGPTAEAVATAANRAAVNAMPVNSWLPVYTTQKAGQDASPVRRAVRCRDVRYPTQFSGLGTLAVLTIDPSKGLDPVDRDAVLTDGDIVYGSKTSIYVTTPRWMDPAVLSGEKDVPQGSSTQIHRFEVTSRTATRYRASGRVPGFLMSQWSMSEQDGVLRVASTDEPMWSSGGQQISASQSQVTTLREQDGRLARVGQVNGLGKGERIYAVRFIGDTGYVVTFRQVDPLYVVDVSDPARPVVKGELKIPGYSAYLHPVGEDLLLGVGQDADENGRVKGTQVSLFDVSNPASPRRLAVQHLAKGWSEAEGDHHAFLYWAPTRLAVLPVNSWESGNWGAEAVGVRVSRAGGITRAGSVTHPGKDGWQGNIRRSVVVGGKLLTISEAGVKTSDLNTLATTGWVRFD